MTEERNDAGQFISAEPLTGLAGEEAKFGYSPMPAPETEPEEFESAREAFDSLQLQEEQSDPVPIVYHNLQTGELADKNETVTLNRSAQDLALYEDSLVDHTLAAIDAGLASEVDELRAQYLKENPEAAAELGIANNNKSGTEPAALIDEQQIENNPKVQEIIAAKTAASDQAQAAYQAGLANSDAMLRATFMSEIPELSGLPPADFEQGLALLQQVDPPRFEKAMNLLGRFNQVQQAQAHHQQYQSQQQHQQFVANVQAEDKRLVEMVGSKAAAEEANAAVRDYLSDHGVPPGDQMVNLIARNPVLASAEGRKTIYEAAKYRAMQKAARATPTRNLPTVQKPGTAQPRVSSGDAEIQALDRELTRTGSVKVAEKLLAARMRG